jgi:glycogen phosphorylase
MAGDAMLGSHLTLRAEVALNGLATEDVCVEAVYGPVDLDDRLYDSTPVRLSLSESADGASWFEGEVPLDRTGAFGYTVRVLPSSELLAEPVELGLVATA